MFEEEIFGRNEKTEEEKKVEEMEINLNIIFFILLCIVCACLLRDGIPG